MAKAFGKTKGSAGKSVETYTYKDGDNRLRLVGGILPRYLYWLVTAAGKKMPIECLAYSRELEIFDNKENDLVPQYFPKAKNQWSYACNMFDYDDGTVKVLNLKKKLLAQIIELAEDLGDPTDLDTGWDIHFKKAKTGPEVYNVEYTLQQRRCKVVPMTDEQKAVIAEAKDIDAKYPRLTEAENKIKLDRAITPPEDDDSDDTADASTKEAVSDLG
jgi:hypothetical protein